MGGKDEIGFYGLVQLASRQGTEIYKERIGIFPWGRNTILRMVDAGTFPAPIKGLGRQLLWPKEVIHAYIRRLTNNGEEDEQD